MKKKKKSNHRKTPKKQKGSWLLFLKLPFSLIFKSIDFIKSNPKLITKVSIILVFFFIALKISTNVNQEFEDRSIYTVEIHIDNPKIKADLEEKIAPLVEISKKLHMKRHLFMVKLNQILGSFEGIESFQARMGLDGILVINAKAFVPSFILQPFDNKLYLLSDTGFIITKINDNIPMKKYPKLEIPELKVNWHKKKQITKKFFSSDENISTFTSPENMPPVPLILVQIKNMINAINTKSSELDVEEIQFSTVSGFTLVVQAASRETPLKTSRLWIHLGNEQLIFRIQQLQSMLKDLAQQNIYPSTVDLDYNGKATFKVNSTQNE